MSRLMNRTFLVSISQTKAAVLQTMSIMTVKVKIKILSAVINLVLKMAKLISKTQVTIVTAMNHCRSQLSLEIY